MNGNRARKCAAALLAALPIFGCGGQRAERAPAGESAVWRMTMAREADSSWMAAEHFADLLSDATDGAVTVTCCAENILTDRLYDPADSIAQTLPQEITPE